MMPMKISSELADALKFSNTSNTPNGNPSMEYDDESLCGSLSAACDDMNDLNGVGTSSSFGGVDPVLLTLEDYEPPASLLMAVLEAERQMDEALSSFSSECSSVVAAAAAVGGAPQGLCDDHDLDHDVPNNNDDGNIIIIAETITATDHDHVINEDDDDRDTREFTPLESLTYSEAKRMAFSPLEAPNTVDRDKDKGGGTLHLESPCTCTDGSDPPLEAFLPNSNCIVSGTPPSNPHPPPQQPTDRPCQSTNIAKRRREALLKHKERTARTKDQLKTSLNAQPHKTHTLTRPLSASTTKAVKTATLTNTTYKSPTQTQVVSTSINAQPHKTHTLTRPLSSSTTKAAKTATITNTTYKLPTQTQVISTSINAQPHKTHTLTRPLSSSTTKAVKTATITNTTYKLPTQTQVISPTLRNTAQKQAHSQQQKKHIPYTKTPLKYTAAAATATTTTCSKPLVPSKAPITRPKSPNLRTTARLGKLTQRKHPTPPGISSKNENDAPKPTNSNKMHKLTIPRPPRLSTSERHGEKFYSTTAAAATAIPTATAITPNSEHKTYSNRSAENSVTSINNTNNKTRLFMADTKSALALPPHFVNTLRDHGGANHGCGSHVNTTSPTSSNIKRKKEPLSVTVPITPQVLKRPTRHSRHTTPSPNTKELSTQQKRELEEMAYIATHQFKARVLPKTTTTAASNTFNNHSRASLSQNSTTIKGPRRFAVAPPTMTPLSSTDEIELTKKFRALPLPKFLAKVTTATKPSAKQNHDPEFALRPKIITIPTPRKPNHPKVPTGTTTFLRGAHNPRTSSGIIHDNTKITPRPTSPKPFNLLSEMRGVLHQEQLQERIRLEEQQRDTLTRSFKAIPVPKFLNKPLTPSRRHSITPLTEPCEFRLRTDLRHELHQAELESKIEAMETRRIMESVIKPLPIPKTLYTTTFKPVMPSELGREPIQGSAPHLETTVQSKRRQSFDQEAKGRREKEERIKKLMEQEEELETDREIRELRQLPANEGGFNPVTNTASLLKLGSSQVTIPARLSLHQ